MIVEADAARPFLSCSSGIRLAQPGWRSNWRDRRGAQGESTAGLGISQRWLKVVTDDWTMRADGRSCVFDRSENEQAKTNKCEWKEKEKKVQC